MMRPRARPSERMSLSAVAAALMLSALLSGPAAGMTQGHCPTKPHTGRHNEKGQQMLVCRIGMSRQQGGRHGISIELSGSGPPGGAP
jgi:hypothetical protein